MPRAKPLSHFPAAYQQMIVDCSINGKEIRVRVWPEGDIPAERRARKLCGNYWAFVGALRRAAEEAGPSRRTGDISDLATRVDSVGVTMLANQDGSVDIVWASRENSWQSKLLRTAQATQAPSAPPEAVETDRLLDLQRRLDGLTGERKP